MSPTLGDTHHDAVRFPPAEPSDRHVRVGPVNMICPCLLTPVRTPRKATNASRAFSALALGHGWPGEQVPSSSLAAIPAKRSRGPSSHQIGPSPSQTWEGVHLKVSPREMTGTSAFAPRGPITKTANPKIAWGMRNFVMAESFMFLVYHEFRILFAAPDTAKRKVQTRVLQVQRMSGMTGRDAASEVIDERQQWAVHVGQIETVQQDCGDAANGSNEPKVFDAANCTDGCTGRIAVLRCKCETWLHGLRKQTFSST